MKITFICAVFPPEPAPSGVMARQLATRLVRDGHHVTMIVPFPNRPNGTLYPGFNRRPLQKTQEPEGYTLFRCATWLTGGRRRIVYRLLENISFGLTSTCAALRDGRPDLMIFETWPLVAIFFCWLLARCWKTPYFYYVKDVYPEAAEELGIIKPHGWPSRILRKWDRKLCRDSAVVITISETMKALLSANRNLSPDRFAVVHDWLDDSLFPRGGGDGAWRAAQNIPEDAFVAFFAGTLGYVSGAEVLIEVAELLRGKRRVLLLAIGEGIRKGPMLREAARLNLNNIRFLPFEVPGRIAEVQSSCDLALLTMHRAVSNTSVPSKLITYLAAARPVVCAARSDSAVAQTVIAADAGLVVPAGDARAIAEAILKLRDEPGTASDMGRSGRRYFEQHFTLDAAYANFSRMLHRIETISSTSESLGIPT